MIIGYLCFFSIALFLFFTGWKIHLTSKQGKKSKRYDITSISVVIPFRNEKDNIPKLLISIQNLIKQPLEFIWVNDHSEDLSIDCLSNLPVNHKIISLSEQYYGKKYAIRKGVELANGSYILTWDADIIVPPRYFNTIEEQSQCELTILPLRMKSNSFKEIFYELDYYFINSINVSFAAIQKPIVASGANLLFDKQTFHSIDSIKNHSSIASGDDQFLLNDFKKNKKQIQLLTNSDLIVETETPKNLKSFLFQRIRWISKTTKIKDKQATTLNLIGVFYLLSFIYLMITSSYSPFILTYKIISDILIFFPFLHVIKRKEIIFCVPLFTLLYPIYFFVICIGLLFVKPTWKGRK